MMLYSKTFNVCAKGTYKLLFIYISEQDVNLSNVNEYKHQIKKKIGQHAVLQAGSLVKTLLSHKYLL